MKKRVELIGFFAVMLLVSVGLFASDERKHTLTVEKDGKGLSMRVDGGAKKGILIMDHNDQNLSHYDWMDVPDSDLTIFGAHYEGLAQDYAANTTNNDKLELYAKSESGQFFVKKGLNDGKWQ